MKYKKFILPLLVLSFIFISCGKDSVTCSNNFSSELSDEIEAFTDALTVYTMDNSSANCEAYKDAYIDYLNALKDYSDCGFTGTTLSNYNQLLEEAENEVQQIQC